MPFKPYLYLLISAIFLPAILSAQEKTSISGRVVDEISGQPIPYATVAVKELSSDNILGGTTTLDDGSFKLQLNSSNIRLEISFIGYKTKSITDISFNNGSAELGEINLESNAENLAEVQVTAEKSSVEFKLDKRVFNVGKDISSTGMSAMDVLGNVPSVNVDIEGQITLRGNSGVQILINGKPSVLADEGGNALGTITADMIESIEVITNPSAKYQAEGTSGILNIILKKEEKKGLNGSASVNTGIPDNHSFGISLNRRTENFNFFTQMGAGYRSIPRYNENINQNFADSTLLLSEGTEFRNEQFYNITLGTDYYINDFNIITLSGNFAYEIEDQPSETDFEFYQNQDELSSKWRRTEETEADNPKYQYELQYERQFRNNEDHKLLFATLGRFFGKEQSSNFTNQTLFGNEEYASQKTRTNFYQADYTFKVDYTNPLTDKITIETGALFEINDVGNDFEVANLQNGNFVVDSNLTNNFEYDQQVLGVYGTGAYEGDRWGVKIGLRVEATDLKTRLTTTNQRNKQVYENLFPSFHTSYKFSERFSLQAGYSRRIYRPRLWDLNPFFNIRNNFNIRQGNPDLLPEFGDSYEVSGIFLVGKASFSSSIYHLFTTDQITRVLIPEGNVSISKPLNIGTNAKTGLEINGKVSPEKWLTITGDFNYGVFQRRGQFLDQNFDFNGNQWSTQLTGKFKLPSQFEFELSGNYNSPFKTVQGKTSGFAFLDFGIRKKLWDGKGIIDLGVRDLFATRINEDIVNQNSYYLYDFSQRGRFIVAGFSYSFGKGEAMTYTGRRR
ncbi:MAG: TonB-dependent receptor domain-containing protein [Luteibaculum sp.]